MSESEIFEQLFNRAADVSTVIHIPVKLFAMYIVFRHSPKNMDALPIFILNVMFWNLMANVLTGVQHINPQFPVNCFRADGPIRVVSENQYVFHVLFGGIFTCILNCALALSFAFPYRYFIFAHPGLVKKVKRKWGVSFCIALHMIICLSFTFSYKRAIIDVDDIKDQLPPSNALFCFRPYGWRFPIVTMIAVTVITVFSFLLRRSLRKVSDISSKQTLELHRKFLLYLLVATAVPLFFGGLPLTTCNFCALYPQTTHCREATMVSILVLANHGTVYSIVSIVTFKPYYDIARKIIRDAFGKLTNCVQIFAIN
ncbi:hypothetical protein QR680_016366 [Steinernema hermaphroditum]|uniref:Uncharacterized protein n=1 Tax=Steinernema hermaphroditum TaxID=289476 RepID=A0AA39HBB4_9BILA|nr:hypothetical protein QR680_016366 [Steinernema hermaphroditum]